MASDALSATTIEELIASGAIVAHKDGNYGSSYPRVEEFGAEGVPFLTAKSLREGYVDIAAAPRLGDARAEELTFGFVQTDDVLLSHNATIGRVAVVPQHKGRLLVGTSLTYFRLNPQKLLPRYLAVYFAGVDFQNQLVAVMSHSTRNQVPVTAQRKLHVVVPPLAEQKAIASILGALDDKIELNRRMNATLEGMARALFQSWFVDFDPVRAKLDGRKPEGMDKATAALFPDAFQESEAGQIPKGWKVGVLDELISFVIGGDWGASEPTEDETVSCYCIRGADIPSLQGGGVGKMPTRFLKQSSVEKRQLMDGDLAIEISGGSPTQCTGRPVLISDALSKSLSLPLVASNFCRIVKLKSPVFSKFVYCWLRYLYDAGSLFQFETGTTGIKNFAFVLFCEKYPLVVPEQRIAEAFDNAVSPLFVRIQANALQSRTLANLRDTLLPKLLSGELSVASSKVKA